MSSVGSCIPFGPSPQSIADSTYAHTDGHTEYRGKHQRHGVEQGQRDRLTCRAAGIHQIGCERKTATDAEGNDDPPDEHSPETGVQRVKGSPQRRSEQRERHRPQELPEIAIRGTSTQRHQNQNAGPGKHHADGAERNADQR